MSRRKDYYDDPHAPAANSLVPATSVVVVDNQDRIVLQRRRDNGKWDLPGGVMELGESLAECAIREVNEETGLDVEVVSIVGVYSDPGHILAYEDGEARQEFAICFKARILGGQVAVSDESHDVGFYPPSEIATLPMEDAIRLRITDYLSSLEPAIR
jgi:ADP-ribose pyrophosphatase YjhB (NUDIX family)